MNADYQEPQAKIARPGCGCSEPEGMQGDAFDEFLAATGGDPAPRGGHADSVKAHLKKITPHNENGKEVGEHFYGQAGITPAVDTRDMGGMSYPGMPEEPKPQARKITRTA